MLHTLVKDAPAVRRYGHSMKDMAQRVKETRKSKGLSQQQLADAIGVTKGAVSQWENGSTANIKLDLFFRLADTLDVDPRWLALGHLDRVLPPLRGFPTSDSGRFRLRTRRP